jgi:Protein of unknown function (DUF2793)
MDATTRWALPLLASGQAQKEITHNEAIVAVDRLLHLAVVSRSVSTPPADASAGDIYIVGAAPNGVWEGAAGQLASFEGAGWAIWPPRPGCLAWVADEQQFAVHTVGDWIVGGWPAQGLVIDGRLVLAAAPVSIANPVGGASIDAECRVALTELLVALRSQNVIL